MARGRRQTTPGQEAPRPFTGLMGGVARRREVRRLRAAAYAQEREHFPVDHPGYLYRYGMPAPAGEIRALEIRMGMEEGSLPAALTLNEVRMASNLSDSRQRVIRAACEEIERWQGRRAPWNADQAIGESIERAAALLAPHTGLSEGEQACAIGKRIGYAFNDNPYVAPRNDLTSWSLGEGTEAMPLALRQEVDAAASEIHAALLTDPRIAGQHLIKVVGFGRDTPQWRELWGRIRPLVAKPAARDMWLGYDRPESHEREFDPVGMALLAGSLRAVSEQRRGYVIGASAEDVAADVDWLEAPQTELADRSPAELIAEDPQGNWLAVMAAAERSPSV